MRSVACPPRMANDLLEFAFEHHYRKTGLMGTPESCAELAQAMQFNLVAASNEGAVRLWQKMGYDIVGTLPGAFRHPQLGFVDAHLMYKRLA